MREQVQDEGVAQSLGRVHNVAVHFALHNPVLVEHCREINKHFLTRAPVLGVFEVGVVGVEALLHKALQVHRVGIGRVDVVLNNHLNHLNFIYYVEHLEYEVERDFEHVETLVLLDGHGYLSLFVLEGYVGLIRTLEGVAGFADHEAADEALLGLVAQLQFIQFDRLHEFKTVLSSLYNKRSAHVHRTLEELVHPLLGRFPVQNAELAAQHKRQLRYDLVLQQLSALLQHSTLQVLTAVCHQSEFEIPRHVHVQRFTRVPRYLRYLRLIDSEFNTLSSLFLLLHERLYVFRFDWVHRHLHILELNGGQYRVNAFDFAVYFDWRGVDGNRVADAKHVLQDVLHAEVAGH